MTDSTDNSGAFASIDWAGELEAAHTDGRVVPVRLQPDRPQPDDNGDYEISERLVIRDGDSAFFFREDGSHRRSCWRIRNRQPATPAIDAGLYERMVAQSQRFVQMEHLFRFFPADFEKEARAIVAALPKPIDPDVQIARDICADACVDDGCTAEYVAFVREGAYDGDRNFKSVFAALKRGKLERNA